MLQGMFEIQVANGQNTQFLVQLGSNAICELQLMCGEGTRSTALSFILIKLIN